MDKEPRLIPAGDQYRDDVIAAIDNAGERIILETMVLDNVGSMEPILESLRRARKRGAYTLLIYDRYAYPSLAMEHNLAALSNLKSCLRDLSAEGVDMQKVGGAEPNPFAGRHHVKAVIADNTIFAAGGINLTGKSFKTLDYMIEFEDKQLADRLSEALPRLATERPVSEVIPVDEESEFILDGGVKNKSAIMEAVQNLATQADKLWYVSKLAPDGDLLKILQTKPTDYWFNQVASATGFDKLALFIDKLKTDIDNNYTGEETLHAKFIVGQMPNGQLEAITGSHNFNSRGVRFGTQELALHTRNQSTCQQLLDFANSL